MKGADLLNIAICDDAVSNNSLLAEQLDELARETGTEINIDIFKSYSQLESAMKEKKFDLLLLETELRGENGIEFAKELRDRRSDAEIIFLSDNADRALEAYEAFPIGYMVKPTSRNGLRPAFRRVSEKLSERKVLILNEPDGGKISVDIEDIIYIEVIGAEVFLHTENGVQRCVESSLTEVYSKLPHERFYRSHRSFIVNLDRVARSAKYHFVMQNGDRVTVAKNRYAEAKQILYKYASRELC